MIQAVGRPSAMTETVVGKLREGFLMGFTDEEACIYAGINRDTLYAYQKKNPEFSDMKRAWKSGPVIKSKFTLFKALDDPKVAQWYLERKCPEEFSSKRTIDVRNRKVQYAYGKLQ